MAHGRAPRSLCWAAWYGASFTPALEARLISRFILPTPLLPLAAPCSTSRITKGSRHPRRPEPAALGYAPLNLVETRQQPRRPGAVCCVLVAELRAQQPLLRADACEER